MIICQVEDCKYNQNHVCQKNDISISLDGKCKGYQSKNLKIVRYKEIYGRILKGNGYASCEFVYPQSLYSDETGFVYYAVDLHTDETEEEIAERLYRSMFSDEMSEFETSGCSGTYDSLQELCEDCELNYEEIAQTMNWQ